MRRIHEFIERLVIRRAEQVIVFNPDYVEQVREANPIAISSPTWYNPTVFGPGNRRDSDEIRICWVGRMERPKDPELALRAFLALDQNTDSRVTLTMVGSGTERGNLIDIVSTLPEPIRARIFLEGRLPPSSVAAVLQDSSIFLMTSVPGYEGYPRVLVEAMACGLPCVVTEGSDTGSLVRDGITGYVVSRREPAELAEAILQATMIDPKNAIDAVSDLDAPTVVRSLIDYGKGGRR
jgi:glycosyltransferase involved in cell wall biosynthesis